MDKHDAAVWFSVVMANLWAMVHSFTKDTLSLIMLFVWTGVLITLIVFKIE